MKNKLNIDQFFKEKFSSLGNPDSSQDWMAMEKMLNQKATKMIVLRWSSALLLLFFIGTVWYSMESTSDKTKSKKQLANHVKTLSVQPQLNIKSQEPIKTNVKAYNSNETAGLGAPKGKKLVENAPLYKVSEQSNAVTDNTDSSILSFEKVYAPHVKPIPVAKTKLRLFDMPQNAISKKPMDQLFVPYAKWQFGVSPFALANKYKRNKPEGDIAKSEKPLNSVSIGLLAFAKYKHLNFSIGINNLNLAERTNYTSTQYTYLHDTSYMLIKRNYETTPNGKTTALVKETITTTTDSTQVINCANCIAKFQYIQVPMAVQYTYGFGRVIYFVEGGVALSFLRKTSGLYTVSGNGNNENNMDYTIANLSKTHANKMLISTNAKLGLKYRINTKLNVFGSYGISIFQQSMLKSYNQKAQLQQLQLGLEIGF